MKTRNLFSAWKFARYGILAAAIAVMASCGTTRNSEGGGMETDTTTTEPFPEDDGTMDPAPTPTPADTMRQ